MGNYRATILFKKDEEVTVFRYKFVSTIIECQKPLFQFLFRNLQKYKTHYPTWVEDNNLTEGFKLQISVYTPNAITSEKHPRYVISFDQELLQRRLVETDVNTNKQTQEPTINRKEIIPIVHIVMTDIFSDNLYWNLKLHSSVPRYFQIIDSSIWNHYVPMVKFDDSVDGFQALFTQAIEEIYENYKNELYEVEVAVEYADINARVLTQSYLDGRHDRGVSPFIFHSETAIKNLIDTEFSEFKEGFKEKGKEGTQDKKDVKWRWRFLLVDDNAINKDGTLKNNCKLSIIMRLILKALFLGKNNWVQYRLLEQNEGGLCYTQGTIDDNARIVIECVQRYDDAIKALHNREYDIILLDYLLDIKDNHRKYGYELLEEINRSVKIKDQFEKVRNFFDYSSDEEKVITLRELISKEAQLHKTENKELISFIKSINVDNQKISPNIITKENIKELLDIIQTEIENEQFRIGSNRKLFFVFISAYSTAVNERLLAQGLNRSESFWHINNGACPTNTPQLFTYNLLHIMNKRLKGCGIHKLSGDKILELIEKIFKPTEKTTFNNDSVRKRASEYYQEVLSLQYHFRRMLEDVEIPHNYNLTPKSIFDIKKSVLISHYSHENQHLSGLLEHLTNLVHIAAFGTIRQWDEMWEEYLYFKAQFKEVMRREKREANEGAKISVVFQRVCEHIESFILGLKSQQR